MRSKPPPGVTVGVVMFLIVIFAIVGYSLLPLPKFAPTTQDAGGVEGRSPPVVWVMKRQDEPGADWKCTWVKMLIFEPEHRIEFITYTKNNRDDASVLSEWRQGQSEGTWSLNVDGTGEMVRAGTWTFKRWERDEDGLERLTITRTVTTVGIGRDRPVGHEADRELLQVRGGCPR